MDRIAEPLKVNYLPRPEETDDVVHVRIVRQPEDIVVGGARLLLCCHILTKIRNGIPLALQVGSGKRHSRRASRIHGVGMVNIVISHAVAVKGLRSLAGGELGDDGANYL